MPTHPDAEDVAAALPFPEPSWRELARVAFGPALVAGLVSGALAVLDRLVAVRWAEPLPPRVDAAADADADAAQRAADAALLGVPLDASDAAVRSAFRARVRAAPDVHPDRGGDAAAMRALLEARDRLLAHAARTQGHAP